MFQSLTATMETTSVVLTISILIFSMIIIAVSIAIINIHDITITVYIVSRQSTAQLSNRSIRPIVAVATMTVAPDCRNRQ